MTYLNDQTWARNAYKKALEAPDAGSRWSDIAISIKNKLGDAAWARGLYQNF